MSVYKCTSCGWPLIPNPDGQTGKCEYCKRDRPLPKAKDDKLQNILNRANDFRIAGDFDRAIYEYEKALEIAEDESEAHWRVLADKNDLNRNFSGCRIRCKRTIDLYLIV